MARKRSRIGGNRFKHCLQIIAVIFGGYHDNLGTEKAGDNRVDREAILAHHAFIAGLEDRMADQLQKLIEPLPKEMQL